MSDPVQVSFTIDEGDVWIDPNEVAWYVKYTGPGLISLERKVVTQADSIEMVRTWRKIEK